MLGRRRRYWPSPLGVVAPHTNTLPPINIHTLQIFVVVVVVIVVCFVDVVYVHFVFNLVSGSSRSTHKHFAADKYPHTADRQKLDVIQNCQTKCCCNLSKIRNTIQSLGIAAIL